MGRREQEKARNFFRQVRKGDLAPLYLFYGEERYLVDRAVEEVVKRVFGDDDPDPFRYEVFRGGDSDGRTIVDAARTVPMLMGKRLVVVREGENLDKDSLKLIGDYLDSPSKRSHIVMTAAKVDGRKPGWKAIKKKGEAVLFESLYRNQMAGWIVRQGKRRKLSVSHAAADYLAEAVGTDMSLVDLALEKLSLLAPDGQIEIEHAKSAVSDTRERSVFELTDALSRRDLAGSIKALESLEEQRVEPVSTNLMIARHVRLLMKVKSGQRRRLGRNDMARFVGVNKFFLKDYVAGARNFTERELITLHRHSYKADKALKSSRLPGQFILEDLVMRFCLRSGS